MNRTVFVIASAVALSFSISALAQDKLSSKDSRALSKLIEANMAEVETGKLAQQKAQNPEIKQFGQHMVDDHGKANDQLKQVAQSKGVTLPTEVNRSQRKDIDKRFTDRARVAATVNESLFALASSSVRPTDIQQSVLKRYCKPGIRSYMAARPSGR